MKRTGALPRYTPLRNKTRIKARSEKQVRIDAARRVIRKRLIAEDPMCRRCLVVPGWDLHEVLRRSQGGDPTDELVLVLICRLCHDWIHANPAKARATGWLIFRKDLAA